MASTTHAPTHCFAMMTMLAAETRISLCEPTQCSNLWEPTWSHACMNAFQHHCSRMFAIVSLLHESMAYLTAMDLSASPMMGKSMVTLFSQCATTSCSHLLWLSTCGVQTFAVCALHRRLIKDAACVVSQSRMAIARVTTVSGQTILVLL